MTFFNYSVPLLRRKKITVDTQQVQGLSYVNWQIGKITLHSTFYTCIDQACIFWSLLLIPMFVTAQFLPVSWSLQATLWTILSGVGTVLMVIYTRYWVQEKQLSWVLYSWVILMFLGLILTDAAIFMGWPEVLLNLCSMWLGLSTLGYFCTGFALRSRVLLFMGILHFLLIFILPYIPDWQFISTGALMVFCLLILAEFQWDMSPKLTDFSRSEKIRQP